METLGYRLAQRIYDIGSHRPVGYIAGYGGGIAYTFGFLNFGLYLRIIYAVGKFPKCDSVTLKVRYQNVLIRAGKLADCEYTELIKSSRGRLTA